MTSRELIKKYLSFFESRGHKIIPGASLIPENDPSALFTNSGMHPLVPYLLGEPHPAGKRLVDLQKCLRTQDIDEVGNSMHLTFFLMLGNWSLGDYFKEEAIDLSWEFLTKELKLGPDRISVTVFAGDENAPRDEETAEIWKKIGLPEERIYFLPKEDNWWEVGETGPCGPDTEMFYDTGKVACCPDCRPGCHCGKYFEIWNDVFMEYERKVKSGPPPRKTLRVGDFKPEGLRNRRGGITYEYVPLKQKNVDTGMGVERTATMLQGKDDVYETEIFAPIVEKIEEISGKSYKPHPRQGKHLGFNYPNPKGLGIGAGEESAGLGNAEVKSIRIIADHLRAATFAIADGVTPSNVERGYIIRRLIRRAVRHGHLLGIEDNFTAEIAKVVVDEYKDLYPELKTQEETIFRELEVEEEQFRRTLTRGLREFDKVANRVCSADSSTRPDGVDRDGFPSAEPQRISGEEAFDLYQTYGFPLELTEELARERGVSVDREGFDRAFKEHQEKSRAGLEKKFAGGLADQSEIVTQYHTATHLLHAALRKVLGEHVEQKGSNITPERLRFDFSHPEKMTEGEIKQVEDLVNQKIKEDLPVKMEMMSLEEAQKQGALAFFGQKYGEQVKVYAINEFSKEVCGGPHVKSTGELGEFKILKEESVSRGTRRLRALLH